MGEFFLVQKCSKGAQQMQGEEINAEVGMRISITPNTIFELVFDPGMGAGLGGDRHGCMHPARLEQNDLQ
jgi:hypothetical protein